MSRNVRHEKGPATKSFEFIRFGAMDATKPYECIGFGARVFNNWLVVRSHGPSSRQPVDSQVRRGRVGKEALPAVIAAPELK